MYCTNASVHMQSLLTLVKVMSFISWITFTFFTILVVLVVLFLIFSQNNGGGQIYLILLEIVLTPNLYLERLCHHLCKCIIDMLCKVLKTSSMC